MNSLKKIIMLLTATFFSYSLVAMEDQDAFKSMPEEVLLYIIRYLNLKDLNHASLVSKRWNVLANDNAIWVVFAASIPAAKILKEEKATWKKFFVGIYRNKKAAEDVLALGSWDKEKVAAAITDENYEKLEETLISHWESVVIAISIEQGITSPKDFLSVLSIHYEINIMTAFVAAWDAAGDVARNDPAWDAARMSAWCIADDVIEDAIDHAAKSIDAVAWDTKSEASEQAALDSAVDDAKNTAMNATKPIVQSQLVKMSSKDPIEMGKDRWRLTSLYVQAYISQKQFLEYFIKAYQAHKKMLDKIPNFRQSKNDTAKILAGYTWEKKELENNPHIRSLQRVVETLAGQTSESINHQK